MASEPKRVSAREAYALLKDAGYAYVDVRTQAEFAEGHPAGAVNVPLALADFVGAMRARFALDAKIVVGCRSGNRSLRAARMLLEAGFTNVVEQRAGWDGVRDAFGQLLEPGWEREGLP